MRRTLFAILLGLSAAVAAAAPASADALETFIRRSIDPAGFSPQNYHPDYRAEGMAYGKAFSLDRAQTIALMSRTVEMFPDLHITSFNLLGRERREGTVQVAFQYTYEAESADGPLSVASTVMAILVPGGPNGYQWLYSRIREEIARDL